MIFSSSSRSLPTLIVGEVLFDRFEDGRSVLGGAPFNVAWNLQGLGRNPTFVSRVGADELGTKIRDRMTLWQMDLRGLQIDTSTGHDDPQSDPFRSELVPDQSVSAVQTGTVEVTVKNGQPSYEIVFPRAYDFVKLPSFADSLDQFSMFYHGTLAFRGQRSRDTIEQMISRSSIDRFVDINIRQPWFDQQWLPTLLRGATYVKMNDEELSGVTGLPCDSAEQIAAAVRAIRARFGGGVYLVTCGSKGAYVVTADGQLSYAAAPAPGKMVDTVGAGDGFAAAAIDGILRQLPYDKVLDRAVRFAARICEIRGATTTDANVYRSLDP